MNPDTIFLVERPFQDVVDDLLIATVGGVTNEPIIFDVKADLYKLAKPALDIRGATGTFEGRRHTFQKIVDFAYEPSQNALVWQEGGRRPDDETTFYVDYFIPVSRSPLTDLNVGSVTRTLNESVGREVAVVYEQINNAYRSAFVDSAEGRSLDHVVAILGIERRSKELAVGIATFFRAAGIDGSISIPEGVAVTTTTGDAVFETTEARNLQRGQARIDVPIRATEAFKGPAGKVDAGAITQIAAPIAGISGVSNFEPTFLGSEDENDSELRARAKAALRSSGKATLAAIIRVILEGRGKPVEVWDPDTQGAHASPPGSFTILVEAEPERVVQLRAAVHETRAAGIEATLVARYVYFKPRVAAQVRPGLTPQGKEKVVNEIVAAFQTYVDSLTSGEPAEGAKLLEAAAHPDLVGKPRLADVVCWRSDLGRPGAGMLADAVIGALATLPVDDAEARRAAIEAVLEAESGMSVPTGRRIPDRSLVQAPDGSKATDQQIEAGEFVVAATVDGQPWWVVLDMSTEDISLSEA